MKAKLLKQNRTYILYDADLDENPELLGFDAKYWAARSAIVGFAEGRGTTFFVQFGGVDYVLRHYRRGGFIARYSEDRYIWTGLKQTRAWREWHLLVWMREKGLPVPQPVAVRIKHAWLTYTADIMTRRIPQTTTLAEELSRHALTEGYWVALGNMLRRFHQQGVYHADLNANNVLLDAGGRFYLIDFDRGRLRKADPQWQLANLARLRRSLDKLKSLQRNYYFAESDWQKLLQGYDSAGLV